MRGFKCKGSAGSNIKDPLHLNTRIHLSYIMSVLGNLQTQILKIRNYIIRYKKKRCSPMVKGRIEFSISFLEPGGKLCTKWQCSIIMLHKLKLRIFQDHSIMGPSQ